MRIANHTTAVYECEGIRLLPGDNTLVLDDEGRAKLKRFLAHPAVTRRMLYGVITLDTKTERPAESVILAEIKKETDLAYLERVAEFDRRGAVKRAARKRHAQVKAGIIRREKSLIAGDGQATAAVTLT